MKIGKFILLFLLSIIAIPLTFAQNETTTPTETFGKIHLSYSIIGEITNLNPYSIFIAMPDGYIEIESSETLPIPSDGVIQATIEKPENVTYYILKPEKLTKFNKKFGFWLPPYTTTKIKLRVYDCNMSIDIESPTEYKFRVIGPAVSNTYNVINIKDIFPYASKEHIKLGKFKLYVDGYVEIYSESTTNLENNKPVIGSGASSIIIPLPLVLKDYKNINLIKDNKAPDIWVNYYDWYHNFMNTKDYYLMKELEKEDVSDFDPTLSDDFDDIDFEDKYFPAMAFTVSDGGGKIEFYYTMEWENNEITELPDII
jgi:hypothetical protein